MRLLSIPFLCLTLLSTLASNTANAQQWGTRAACAPAPVGVQFTTRIEYAQPAAVPTYVPSARSVQLYAPAPAPVTYYYTAPAFAAPVYYAAPAGPTVETRYGFFGRVRRVIVRP